MASHLPMQLQRDKRQAYQKNGWFNLGVTDRNVQPSSTELAYCVTCNAITTRLRKGNRIILLLVANVSETSGYCDEPQSTYELLWNLNM